LERCYLQQNKKARDDPRLFHLISEFA
jgi:hypothetical protein